MDLQRATAGWTTAEQYSSDPIRWTTFILAMLAAPAMNRWLRRYRWGNRIDLAV
jgi:hypothetical protein